MPPKTSRVLAWVAWLAAAVMLLAFMAAAAVFWRPELIRPLLVQAMTPSGGSANLENLEISLSPPRLVLHGFQSSRPGEVSLSLKKVRLDFELSGLWSKKPWLELVEAEGLHVELKPSRGASDQPLDLGGISLILAVKKASVKDARLSFSTSQGRLDWEVARLTIEPQADGRRLLRLESRAAWSDPSGKRLAWARLAGSGALDQSPSLDMALNVSEGGLAMVQLDGSLTGALKVKLSQMQVQVARLSITVAQGQGRLTPASLQLHGHGGLDGDDARLELDRLSLGERIQLSGKFKGSLGHGLRGDLDMQGRAGFGQVEIGNARLSSKLAGSLASPRLESFTADIPAGGVTWLGSALPLGELRITGKGALDSGNSFHLEDWECRAGRLGAFGGSLLLEDWLPKSGVIKGTALQADGLWALAQTFIGQAATGWQAKGKVELSAELGGEQAGQWQAKLVSSDLGFSSSDGAVLVGQLAGQLALAGTTRAQPDIKAALKLSAGQALWGTVFLDLAKAPLELESQARLAAWDDLRQIRFKGRWGGFGRFSGQGDVALQNGVLEHQGSLLLEELNLDKLFTAFVRDPYSISLPLLTSWEVKGKARLEIKGVGKGAEADCNGRLQISQASLVTGQGSRVGNLELDLPLAYALGRPAPAKPPRPKRLEWGSIKLSDLKMPNLELGRLEMPLALTPNRLWVLGSIEVPLAGGKAVISDLQVDEPLSLDFQARCMAELQDLNLAALAGPSLPLQGFIGGRLSEVRLTRRFLQTKGLLEGSLFGGSLKVRGVAAELPFSPGREFKARLEARQVHMEPLSQALKVGRITGRLDADMNGLRLAYGQPVAFQLKVKSVSTPGVEQQVSLMAVNSISLLGTGAGLSGIGLGLFASFFKEFPYEKIAFSCDLKNDVFRVRGLIHEDGVEYLVKRPLLMGINVINRNPDNRISFSDMLERLQRVQQDNTPRQNQAEAKEER